MKHPVVELREALAAKPSTIGTVVGQWSRTLVVETAAGTVLAQPNGELRRGDRVTLAGGLATLQPAGKKIYAR